MRVQAMLLASLVVAANLCAGGGRAQESYLGHCTDDASVSPENVISACTGFISESLRESWRMQYIPEAMVYMAAAYERLGKYEKAEGELKGVITKYPAYAPAWENLGELLEKLKGPGMLMSTMDAMLHANPGNAAVLNAACWIRATKGEQLDAALADCDEALRLKPGDADALDSRAFVRFRKGNFAQAMADANSALAANPKLAGSLYVRGLAKLKSGDAAGGNADVTAAQAIDPKIAATYAAYGLTP